jgi:hypothetical protein
LTGGWVTAVSARPRGKGHGLRGRGNLWWADLGTEALLRVSFLFLFFYFLFFCLLISRIQI